MKRFLSALIVAVVTLVAASRAGTCDVAHLRRRVAALLAAHRSQMEAGVAIIDIEKGQAVMFHGHTPCPLASVFKLPVLVEAARQMTDSRTLTLETMLTMHAWDRCIGSGILYHQPPGTRISMGRAIELMETISDNTAADLVFRRIGLGSVNRMMRASGFHDTDISLTNRDAWLITLGMGAQFRGMSAAGITKAWQDMSPSQRRQAAARIYRENRKTSIATIRRIEDASRARPWREDREVDATVDNHSSPYDLATLLVRLYRGQMLDPHWTAWCMGVLARQHYNSRIPRYLPRGTRIWHKTGTDEGVVNDAGIIEAGPHDHVAVVVLVHAIVPGGARIAGTLIAQIARAAYDAFRPYTR